MLEMLLDVHSINTLEQKLLLDLYKSHVAGVSGGSAEVTGVFREPSSHSCVCVRVYMYTCIYIYVHKSICIYSYKHICIYKYTCVCVYVQIYVTYICIHVNIHIYSYVNMNAYVYI